ncbi:oxysterol-binding protein-related protein 8 isoform X2 [Parasteatoda tepidariorum]|uniref:oxysterol-binding protein-related protein 8 isoform X2 n=1 Tax=Parasteatoda tepidariorum TaxID=114398 RepID=UPI00077F88B3|nr:oxysterol-binding protein-related protein 8 isoform X3 [Parasteatoda tepidariorum]
MEQPKHIKTIRSVSSPPDCRRRHTSVLAPSSSFLSELSASPVSPPPDLKSDDLNPVFFSSHDLSEEHSMTPRYSEVSSTPSTSPKGDMTAEPSSTSKLDKRESYKAQRKNYRREKKRVAKELSCTLKDPTIIVLADWLKVRGTLKGWTKLWCVLKPGLLLLYKSPKTHKSSQWVGTVLLNACELIERPSKKDGFCFKLYHPMEQSIWASKGPKGETIGALVQPLPVAHLIFRAPSEQAGKCWMDALELALRCSSLLMRTMSGREPQSSTPHGTIPTTSSSQEPLPTWKEIDPEKHFQDHDLDDDVHTDDNKEIDIDIDGIHSIHSTDSESEAHPVEDIETPPVETPYMANGVEEFGLAGDAGQTEEVAEENKSLIWTLVKQVRPGMDLSKVVLPTFILEPRSFLDKLSDYYYHSDIIAKAVHEDDPFTRMKLITKFYLSGFYKKPKGLKKPYNPILGEMFRCFWQSSEIDSRTFYIAEQVSHHPPVSAFYVSNRHDGFCIHGSILAKSRFYGNSISAIMDGTAHLTLLTRGEDYTITMPYAHCKGILMGTLTLELGGKVDICCEKTGYHTELEFKLKPFLGGSEYSNLVTGKIKLGKETLSSIEGHWDGEIFIKDKRSGEEHLFWNPDSDVRANRLKRFTVPVEYQDEYESERLWQHVSYAILKGDQIAATEEKTLLEEAQRKSAKERQVKLEKWSPKHFVQDIVTGEWVYKYADSRPWDPRTDVLQYEYDFKIQTLTKHKPPTIRTGSIISVEDTPKVELIRHLSVDRVLPRPAVCIIPKSRHRKSITTSHGSESSSMNGEAFHGSDSTESDGPRKNFHSKSNSALSTLQQSLQTLQQLQQDSNQTLRSVQLHMETIMNQQRKLQMQLSQRWDYSLVAILVLVQILLHWFL